MTIIVCSLASLPDVVRERRPSHVISLLNPEMMIETLEDVPPGRHLRLVVHDIHEPMEGLIAPDEAMVERLLAFGRGWDGAAPLVVHCLAGVSRSSASAVAIACQANPHASELEIALQLRERAPHVYPNRRITAIADAMLGRDGRLIAAVEAMGGDDLEVPHLPVELPARFPARAPAP